MQRYHVTDGKLESEEANPVSLYIVVNDDKVDELMNNLDGLNLSLKSSDFKMSPLLQGKNDF